MTTPDDDPTRGSGSPDSDGPRDHSAGTTTRATTVGLVVTEERLADGRRITYYGISR
ncbi:hypothetical protein LQ327_27115 [Actinomycetospora endophytica]|uniref:Uncharacterized protein n=1 Tax=Actinomycetospora endophytica TaxID=2291215 RepID=A0ABS8PFL8_9PSEU|nr:hypothetical protein [Actinomycetospora endophytica]MCD2197048.1 hypothetical protein [Actinomycetospora endophytica]